MLRSNLSFRARPALLAMRVAGAAPRFATPVATLTTTARVATGRFTRWAPAVAVAAVGVTAAVQLRAPVQAQQPARTDQMESTFKHFATVVKDGQRYMTRNDFMRSIVPFYHPRDVTPNAKTHLDLFFRMADANGDGLISYSEYVTFVSMLSTPAGHYQMAFKMFDINGSGDVDLAEFKEVLKAQAAVHSGGTHSIEVSDDFVKQFFGADGKGRLTFEGFQTFMDNLHREILSSEFRAFDPRSTGSISVLDFCTLITSHIAEADTPAYITDNIKKLASLYPDNRVTIAQFLSFSEFLGKIDEVEQALRVYTAGTNKVDKADLQKASKAAGVQLSQMDVDMIFLLFDANNDGVLDHNEFINTMRHRTHQRRFTPVNVPRGAVPKFKNVETTARPH